MSLILQQTPETETLSPNEQLFAQFIEILRRKGPNGEETTKFLDLHRDNSDMMMMAQGAIYFDRRVREIREERSTQ